MKKSQVFEIISTLLKRDPTKRLAKAFASSLKVKVKGAVNINKLEEEMKRMIDGGQNPGGAVQTKKFGSKTEKAQNDALDSQQPGRGVKTKKTDEVSKKFEEGKREPEAKKE